MTTPALPDLPARVREAIKRFERVCLSAGDYAEGSRDQPSARAALETRIREGLGERGK